jgi:nucleoside-diphosphate-sugar epimerase
VLPEHFTLLERAGARRLVMLSSTSRFTKSDSSDASERAIALRLSGAEDSLRRWAESKNIEWVVLRPTLIYGRGRDKNIAEIARFIRRFGFFPLIGQGMGLRQPVHAEDVASACVGALESTVAVNRAYNLSGGETLAYREMVARVFVALRRHPRLVKVPRHFFRMAVRGIRLLPGYHHWTPAMVERMNHDLVFDHTDAARDFSFSPRSFYLAPEDLPR